jgi:hypothetical protein
MTSLAYNTFSDTNINNTNINNTNINNTNINTSNNCIICLQNSTLVHDIVTSMNDMHFLIKTCDCLCYSHHKCIEAWIQTNSTCPICRKPVSFPQINSTVIDISQSIQNGSIQNGSIQNGSIQNDSIQYELIHKEDDEKCKQTLRVYLFILIIIFFTLMFVNIYCL